jgi:hydrophobic/amphiphilic exporter-1 (mainly G- bacteria), HAE1 family
VVLASVVRENQQYTRQVSYEFRGPAKLGDAVLDAMLARTELPPGYTIKKATFSFFTPEDQKQLYLVLAVSLLLIYMVTAATFESLIQPLCVLFAVPMGLIGTFMVFFYTNATFTREAYIGVIMAGGIVVNNAILLIDHINTMRAVRGTTLDDAIVQGTLQRVRPILMTSVTTVMGLSPLVLFSDADATIWNAMGFTLIGGLVSSTFLVLTVTPALYKLFERKREAPGVVVVLPALAPAGD